MRARPSARPGRSCSAASAPPTRCSRRSSTACTSTTSRCQRRRATTWTAIMALPAWKAWIADAEAEAMAHRKIRKRLTRGPAHSVRPSRLARASRASMIGGRRIIAEGLERAPWTDFYHNAMTVSWPTFFGALAAAFVVLNLLFALVYMLGEDADRQRAGRAASPISSSSASRRPRPSATATCIRRPSTATSSRPSKTSSAGAVRGDDRPGLRAFLAAARAADLRAQSRDRRPRRRADADRSASPTRATPSSPRRAPSCGRCAPKLTAEGRRLVSFERTAAGQERESGPRAELDAVSRDRRGSPLSGLDVEDVAASEMNFVVSISGLDETSAQVVHARHTFAAQDVRPGHEFVDIISLDEDGMRHVDYAQDSRHPAGGGSRAGPTLRDGASRSSRFPARRRRNEEISRLWRQSPGDPDGTASDARPTHANRAAWRALLDELADAPRRRRRGRRRPKARERHVARGKLLARERVARLIDPGSPFLEIGALAAFGMYEGDVHGAGMVAGIGRIDGREAMIVANDPTIKGGAYYPMTVKKHLRAQEIARENRCPASISSIPAAPTCRIRPRSFPTASISAASSTIRRACRRRGIAQIAVVMGSCTAGGAYVPAMSDETIIVEKQGTIFLAGPPLVKAATGETVSAEELGGGDLHTRVSGVADAMARDDVHALALARRAIANLNRRAKAAADVAAPRRAALSGRGARGDRAGRSAQAIRRARDHRAAGRRLGVRRVQGALRNDAGDRLRAPFRHADRHRRQQRRAVLRKRAERRAFRRAVRAARHPAAVPAEHLRLHGRAAIRGRRHRQGRRQAGDRGRLRRACRRSR